MSHTPGPWIADDHDIVAGEDPERGELLATAYPMEAGGDVLANARLIAAAPDLLGALIIIVNTTEGIFNDYRDNAERAIKKAGGR